MVEAEVSVSAVLTEFPLRVADRVAVWLELMVPACTENPAAFDPAAAVTELGALNAVEPVRWMAMCKPPLGAAADNVILHFEDECELSVVGLHDK